MQTQRRLTSFSHGAGCGCKLGPDQLTEVLGGLSLPDVPSDVLVAAETGDDAAVYALDDDRALVATLDFFTPIVDDPYDWGRIAATNAMSDVYAMGGTPFLGLNIVSWPVDDLPLEMLGSVLQGGIDAATRRGLPGARRALDHRSRAEVRHGRARFRRPAAHAAQLDRRRGRRPRAHEAARPRHDLDGRQARCRDRRDARDRGRADDHAERGRGGGRRWR